MTAPLLVPVPPGMPRTQRFISRAGLGFAPVKYKKDNGVFVVEREAVFRSGTYRDSLGDQMTYESLHIKQMLDNFDYLKSSGLLPNIPARDGHDGFLLSGIEGNGRVVGWHTGISVEELTSPVDGEKYSYVLADYEITEPWAAEKYERGTWRNRSAEIYRWVTNAEAEFWPVYGGFAFVDIPAVEGLNFSRDPSGGPGDGARYFVMRETTVTSPAPVPPAQPQTTLPAPSQPLAQPSTPAPAQHMFSVNGRATSNYAEVQQHITALETAQTEARNLARGNFVTALASRGLIVGSEDNLRSMTAFAQGLTDEQFETWSAGYAAAQTPALFGQHAVGQATGAVAVTGQTVGSVHDDELEVAKSTVSYLRASMSESEVQQTPSYKKLVAAGIEK